MRNLAIKAPSVSVDLFSSWEDFAEYMNTYLTEYSAKQQAAPIYDSVGRTVISPEGLHETDTDHYNEGASNNVSYTAIPGAVFCAAGVPTLLISGSITGIGSPVRIFYNGATFTAGGTLTLYRNSVAQADYGYTNTLYIDVSSETSGTTTYEIWCTATLDMSPDDHRLMVVECRR